jgi:hypothetical protein
MWIELATSATPPKYPTPPTYLQHTPDHHSLPTLITLKNTWPAWYSGQRSPAVQGKRSEFPNLLPTVRSGNPDHRSERWQTAKVVYFPINSAVDAQRRTWPIEDSKQRQLRNGWTVLFDGDDFWGAESRVIRIFCCKTRYLLQLFPLIQALN